MELSKIPDEDKIEIGFSVTNLNRPDLSEILPHHYNIRGGLTESELNFLNLRLENIMFRGRSYKRVMDSGEIIHDAGTISKKTDSYRIELGYILTDKLEKYGFLKNF